MIRIFLLLLFVIFQGACASAAALDALTKNDPGARKAAKDIAYGEKDRQKLDVYVPEVQAESAPLMIFIYGGSWKDGSKDDYEFVGHAFASRGFITILADYRLVPEVRYPEFVEDCAASVKWAVDHAADYGGDPESIFLSGHSAGAYNVMMVTLAPEFLESFDLSSENIAGTIGISGPYSFLPLAVDATKAAFAHVEDLESTQPIERVGEGGPPILLLNGSDDQVVSPRNVPKLAEILSEANREVETKIYPGLTHTDTVMALSLLFRDKAPVLDDIINFTAEVLNDTSPQ